VLKEIEQTTFKEKEVTRQEDKIMLIDEPYEVEATSYRLGLNDFGCPLPLVVELLIHFSVWLTHGLHHPSVAG